MNNNNTLIINEKSEIIPIPIIIPQNSPTKKNELINYNEYSLKQNFFDPSKASPPNNFLLKLQLRMSYFETLNKADNLTNE